MRVQEKAFNNNNNKNLELSQIEMRGKSKESRCNRIFCSRPSFTYLFTMGANIWRFICVRTWYYRLAVFASDDWMRFLYAHNFIFILLYFFYFLFLFCFCFYLYILFFFLFYSCFFPAVLVVTCMTIHDGCAIFFGCNCSTQSFSPFSWCSRFEAVGLRRSVQSVIVDQLHSLLRQSGARNDRRGAPEDFRTLRPDPGDPRLQRQGLRLH